MITVKNEMGRPVSLCLNSALNIQKSQVISRCLEAEGWKASSRWKGWCNCVVSLDFDVVALASITVVAGQSNVLLLATAAFGVWNDVIELNFVVS